MTPADVEKLLKVLHEKEVNFVVIGGAAAVLQNSAYVTAEIRKSQNKS